MVGDLLRLSFPELLHVLFHALISKALDYVLFYANESYC